MKLKIYKNNYNINKLRIFLLNKFIKLLFISKKLLKNKILYIL